MNTVSCHSMQEVEEVQAHCMLKGFKTLVVQMCLGQWEVRYWI